MTNQSNVDSVESLAMTMHAQPGVYALLLGSGVSRGAGILTGWEVMVKLIEQLAVQRGQEVPDDPTGWYHDTFGRDANYSDLLKELGPTPTTRKAILQRFFEPNTLERAQGLKQPSLAHTAIAELVNRGYVKVIVTTNFDRLIENALREAGIEPVVLSTPAQIQGAEPFMHVRCCVIKLHGDYLSPETLNTAEELSDYDPDVTTQMQRIATDFGLVVCGWSADWDHALRQIMASAISKHYPTYWHVFRTSTRLTKELIAARSAQSITNGDADDFFGALKHQVVALEEFVDPSQGSDESAVVAEEFVDPSQDSDESTLAAVEYEAPPQDSDEQAVVTLERLLSEDRYRIQLAAQIKRETDEPTSRLNAQPLVAITQGAGYSPQIAERILSAEREVGRLIKLFALGGYWSRPDSISIWSQAIAKVGSINEVGQYDLNLAAVRQYASFLILYSFGLGAVAASKIDALTTVLTTEVPQPFNERKAWPQIIKAHVLQIERSKLFNCLPDYKQKYFPFSERVHDVLMPVAGLLPINQSDFDALYDELEVLISLAVVSRDEYGRGGWSVPGRYAYRVSERTRILDEVRGSLAVDGELSPYAKFGLFGSSVQECLESIADFESFAVQIKPNPWVR